MPFRRFTVIAALIAAAGFAQASPQERWEIMSRVEMSGEAAGPARKITLCLPTGQMTGKRMIPERHGCEITEFSTSGDTSRFELFCESPHAMSGKGEISRRKDAFSGTLSAHGTAEGKGVWLKSTFSGKRSGSCAGTQPVKPMASMIEQARKAGVPAAQLREMEKRAKEMEKRQVPR